MLQEFSVLWTPTRVRSIQISLYYVYVVLKQRRDNESRRIPERRRHQHSLHWIQRVSSLTAHCMFSSFPIYRVYLNTWTFFRSDFSVQKKKIYVNKCPRTLSFRVTSPSSLRFSRFNCYMWKHLRTPSAFLPNWKLREALPTQFWCLLNHSHPLWDIWKGATVHDQKCLWGHWIQVEDISSTCCEIWLDKQ
jgi:hypothetical protein